ncbi:MAG: SecD/SecF fusion protein [Acidobacteriota bacterium]|nr:SecD/SecF fusion protein [Acidobacteriota bacterium]
MKRKLLGRGLLILAVVLSAIALAYPPKNKINLGLDLQGGMHLVLQVHTVDALRATVDNDVDRLTRLASDKGFAGVAAHRVGDTGFEVTGATEANRDQVVKLVEDSFRDYQTRKGAPGLAYEMSTTAVHANEKLAVSQAKTTIDNRVNQFGVTEPVIQEATGNRIVVELPGVDDPERVRRLIKNTAFLEFRLTRMPKAGSPALPTRQAVIDALGGQVPPDVEILEGDLRDANKNVTGKQFWAVEKKRVMTGRELKDARPSQGQFQEPVVAFSMTPAGSEVFGAATAANVGTGLAIVLDGRVVTAPVIKSKISDSGVIEGHFSTEEVQDLSTALRSGALPAGLTYLEERTVGPSLGRDSIQQGLLAGVIGTSLVILTMLLVYHLSGVNAVMALLLNVLIVFGGMGAFHSTLTLPGIAGIILTIGMAVDANVLVFERIREEMRAGRTLRSAIDLGFERAFSSIIDTHVTTIVSALFLFQFGTGPIKGFAVTLTIGLIASLFTAVFVSKWIFDFWLSRRWVHNLTMTRLFQDTNFDFMKWRKFWIVASLLLVLGGVLAILGLEGRHINLGIDFAGGTQMELRFKDKPQIDNLRRILETQGLGGAQIQRFGGQDSNEAIIKTAQVKNESGTRERIESAFDKSFNPGNAGKVDLNRVGAEQVAQILLQADPDHVLAQGPDKASEHYTGVANAIQSERKKDVLFASWDQLAAGKGVSPADIEALKARTVLGAFTVIGVEHVGPQVGKELRSQGLWAVFASLLGMLLYIGFRFEPRFGIGAIMACIHDVLVTLGLFTLMGYEFNLTTIAAFLTLIGYSVNDTVVIFDRMRENMRKNRRKPLIEIMNESINQTLSRTVMTSGLTMLTVAALLVFGGDVLHGFAFVMTVGIIVGTYSSIYVASPFALLWEQLFGSQGRLRKGGPAAAAAATAKGVPAPASRSTPPVAQPGEPRPAAPNRPTRVAGRRR